MAYLSGEAAAIGCAKNRSAASQERTELLIIELDVMLRLENSLVAAEKTDGFPTAFGRRFGHGADHGVQARAIASAGYNSDAFAHGISPCKSSMIFRHEISVLERGPATMRAVSVPS